MGQESAKIVKIKSFHVPFRNVFKDVEFVPVQNNKLTNPDYKYNFNNRNQNNCSRTPMRK